jgi:multicomponent Na+:H+ antiporter subunit A
MRAAGSLILTVSVRTLFQTILAFSLYLLFAGHNTAGGGFAGGLVAGAALVLRLVEGGPRSLRDAVPAPPGALLGTGIAVAGLTGAAGWLGGGYLESGKLSLELPLLGTVKATSSLGFDVGVYLVVVGLVATILRTLGEEDLDEGRHGGGEAAP